MPTESDRRPRPLRAWGEAYLEALLLVHGPGAASDVPGVAHIDADVSHPAGCPGKFGIPEKEAA